jgi:hypothetical protein
LPGGLLLSFVVILTTTASSIALAPGARAKERPG